MQAAGKYRQEGKTYVVQDGDIIFFKFNVSSGGKKWSQMISKWLLLCFGFYIKKNSMSTFATLLKEFNTEWLFSIITAKEK